MTDADGRRWFLRLGDGPWREVDKKEWVETEGGSFHGGRPGEPSTGGFSSMGVSGRILDASAQAEQYAFDPAFQAAAFPTEESVEDLVWHARKRVRSLKVMSDRQRTATFEEISAELEVVALKVRALERRHHA